MPIGPDLFTTPDGQGRIHLLASRCLSCDERMFPVRMRCVACYSADLETVKLGRVGKVESHTIVRQSPPGYGGKVPYVLATVLLGNRVRVLSHLIGKREDEWAAGDEVASCAIELPVASPEGASVLSYAFRDVALDNNLS